MRLLLIALLFSLLSFAEEKLNYKQIKEAYYRSYMYEKVRDYENAIRALLPVYEAYPNGYTINLRLGWLYYLWGKYKNSEFHYRKAVKISPSSVEAKLGLSLPLKAQNRWSEVEELMYEILKEDYYNYYGNLYLCQTLEAQRKYDLVRIIAEKMLYLYPIDVNFLVYLAKAYFHTDEKQKAMRIFKDVIILDPENTEAKKYLRLK